MPALFEFRSNLLFAGLVFFPTLFAHVFTWVTALSRSGTILVTAHALMAVKIFGIDRLIMAETLAAMAAVKSQLTDLRTAARRRLGQEVLFVNNSYHFLMDWAFKFYLIYDSFSFVEYSYHFKPNQALLICSIFFFGSLTKSFPKHHCTVSETGCVSENEESMPCPGQGYVHSVADSQEADVLFWIVPDQGEDHDIVLFSLEVVHCLNLDVT